MNWYTKISYLGIAATIFFWSRYAIVSNLGWTISTGVFDDINELIHQFILQGALILSVLFAIVCAFIPILFIMLAWKYREAFQ